MNSELFGQVVEGSTEKWTSGVFLYAEESLSYEQFKTDGLSVGESSQKMEWAFANLVIFHQSAPSALFPQPPSTQ